MIGTIITYSQASDVRVILHFGMSNALFTAFIFSLLVYFHHNNAPSAWLAGVSVYSLYMLRQHRKMFVLHQAPDLTSIHAGYRGSSEDFWNFVAESKLTMRQMEVSFWKHFWGPPLIAIGFVLLFWLFPAAGK